MFGLIVLEKYSVQGSPTYSYTDQRLCFYRLRASLQGNDEFYYFAVQQGPP